MIASINVRQNTAQLQENLNVLQRTEQRSAYDQHDRYRLALLDPEVAKLFLDGLAGESLAEPVDRLRFNNLLIMVSYSAQNNWECLRSGITDEGEWERTASLLSETYQTPGGKKWWKRTKSMYMPGFVAAMETHFPSEERPST